MQVVCAYAAFQSLLVWGAATPASAPSDARLFEAERIIHDAFASKDLGRMEGVAKEIHAKWRGEAPASYGRLMVDVVVSFRNGRFNDERQYLLAQQYARLALQKASDLPLQVELCLLGYLREDLDRKAAANLGEPWPSYRAAKAALSLHGWQRLEEAIDPSWDRNDLPLINTPLPNGVPGVAGMDPAGIADPVVRAEYEAAVQRNRKKAETYRIQYELRQDRDTFVAGARRYIVDAYSKPPLDWEALDALLARYLKDPTVRAAIIEDARRAAAGTQVPAR